MIHLSNISKQHGNKILYRNGSFQINAGEKIGLVGPNGAGKTTIFRIITGEEGIDGGSISKSDRTSDWLFSQDIADMHGRSALEEVKSAVGNIGDMQTRMQESETKLADPELDADEMTRILEMYGELQGEFGASRWL